MNKTLLIVAAVIGGAWVLNKRGTPSQESNNDGPLPNTSGNAPDVIPTPGGLAGQLETALRTVVNDFGVEVARNVERIYRLETANFTSLQFAKTCTPGMRAFGNAFPWAWSLKSDGLTEADFLPPVVMAENAGGPAVPWVVFRALPKAVHFVGYFLNKYGNRVGRWHNTDNFPDQQAAYTLLVSTIPTPLVDNLV
jgi:hypothetical protein